ncbi:hypothetical protein M404DRAFT_838527 [Pisolithus tinctorius Marx 270]|uniref:Uncharacterized protein n=1 Tax=Pisolithus tinctorius Marx 270 TaxID=870435 RepID=A0A0C3PRL0_PISTI|nr:hypothetical protein M404DRAFT_838527 [Pisolithus tinctorius Marx 270]
MLGLIRCVVFSCHKQVSYIYILMPSAAHVTGMRLWQCTTSGLTHRRYRFQISSLFHQVLTPTARHWTHQPSKRYGAIPAP